MGIGTSLGAFHEDEFAHIASPWMMDPEDIDKNVVDPKGMMNEKFNKEPVDNTTIDLYGKKSFDENITDPNKLMESIVQGKDPNLIYDDSGNVIDYSLSLIDIPIMNPIKN